MRSLRSVAAVVLFAMAQFTTAAGVRSAGGRLFGPVISFTPPVRHTATVIMLHGLGDTGNGWAPVAQELNLPHVKWVFPTAPTRPITVNMGMDMPGWFDIAHLDESSLQAMMRGHQGFDAPGTAESVAFVEGLISKEQEGGIPPNRIVVGGFSQGGHVALRVALQHAPRLAGCAALSTWLEPSPLDIPPANLGIPIFYGHGAADPLIPPTVASATQASLQQDRGLTDVRFKFYPGMGHSACPQEMSDLKRFILEVVPDAAPTADDVKKMSAKELKAFIQSQGQSTTGLLEKSELVDKAMSLL